MIFCEVPQCFSPNCVPKDCLELWCFQADLWQERGGAVDGPREARPASGHCCMHRAMWLRVRGFCPEHCNLVNLSETSIINPYPLKVPKKGTAVFAGGQWYHEWHKQKWKMVVIPDQLFGRSGDCGGWPEVGWSHKEPQHLQQGLHQTNQVFFVVNP